MRMRLNVRLLPMAVAAAGLLLAAKAGDMWIGADAVSEELGLSSAQAEESQHADSAGAPDETGIYMEGEDFDPMMLSRAEIELLQGLRGRREQIESREREVELREQTLAAAENRLGQRIGELKQLKAEVEGLFNKYDEEQEQRMRSLVKIYENMKPKDAARIFETMDGDIMLDVIERMREAKTAPIMALLTADRAKRLTRMLAERDSMPTTFQ